MPTTNSAVPPKGYPTATAPPKPSENPAYGLPPTPQYVPPNPSAAYMAAAYPVNAPAAAVGAGCTPAPPASSTDLLPMPTGVPTSTSTATGLASGSAPLPAGSMRMQDAGAFSDLISKIKPVKAAAVTPETAAERLVALKEKFNELQKIRARYHTKQIVNGATGAGGAIFSLGLSVVASGAAAVHQRNRLQQVVAAMRQCLEQINILRAQYAGSTQGWEEAEKRCTLEVKAFTKALNRNELHGEF